MAEKICSKNIRLKYTNSNETTHSLLMFLENEFGIPAIRGIICGEKIDIQREIHAVIFLKDKPGKRLKQLSLNNSSCAYSPADLINDFKDVFHMENRVFVGDDFELNIWYNGLSYKQDAEILKQKDDKIKEQENKIKELKLKCYDFIGSGDEKSITVNISNNNNKIYLSSSSSPSWERKREIGRQKERKVIKKYPIKQDFLHIDSNMRKEISDLIKKVELRKEEIAMKNSTYKINLEINTRKIISAHNSSSDGIDELPLKIQKKLIRK